MRRGGPVQVRRSVRRVGPRKRARPRPPHRRASRPVKRAARRSALAPATPRYYSVNMARSFIHTGA